jgi:hypothetical protein
VLIAGGCSIDGCELNARGAETELFDPATGGFRPGPRLRRPRVGHAAFRLLLVTGGGDARDLVLSTTEVYDSRTGRFARGPAMTTNRYKHAAVPARRR